MEDLRLFICTRDVYLSITYMYLINNHTLPSAKISLQSDLSRSVCSPFAWEGVCIILNVFVIVIVFVLVFVVDLCAHPSPREVFA